MITSNGKNVIRRFHARQLGQIGGALAFGVGSASENVNDTRLQYEVVRVPLLSVNVDPVTGSHVYRVSLQPGTINTIYEVGLWSANTVTSQGYTLGILGNSPNSWINGTLTNSNARANANTLQVNYVANGTTNAELSGFAADLSRFHDIDSMIVGYHATTNLSSIRIRLGSDASNYYEFLLPAPTANSYNIAQVTRSAGTKTGNPNWEQISYIAVRPSASAGGSGSIFFDGIRFEANTYAEENLLVARSVLTTPHVLDAEIASDIEYSFGVTFT